MHSYDTRSYHVFYIPPEGRMLWCIVQANNSFQAIDKAYTKYQDKHPNRKLYKCKSR